MSVKKLIEAMQDIEIVDLGQVFEENMPAHPSHSRFFRMPWHSPALGDIATDYQLVINEHNGTHVDSFRHYIAKDGYEWIDGIPLERFQAPFVVIDATYLGKCETLSLEAVKQWEAENGEIEKGCAVLVDTGWMRYWANRPDDQMFTRGYPGLSGEAAQYFVDKGVGLVGIDTLGIDCFDADGDPAHVALLTNKVLIVENLNNLGKLHGKKGYFIMLPLKLKDGSGSPVRPIALIDKE